MVDKLLEELESWRGTKWRHLQAVKGHGVDCIQFPVAVAKAMGWLPVDYKTIKYARDWATHNSLSILINELGKVADKLEISTDNLMPGDIVVMQYEKTPGHAAVYAFNGNLYHAHIRDGVCVTPLAENKKNIDSYWRFKK